MKLDITVNHVVSLSPALMEFLNKGPAGSDKAEVLASLARLEATITEQGALMTQQMQKLRDEVQRNNTVTQGALTLISGLRQQIQDAIDDPAAMQQLVDSLATQDNNLAAALVQNTGAAATEPAVGGAQAGSMGTGAASQTGDVQQPNPTGSGS